jgi:ABC-type molybdenum transport system ATPase subunit/photorepair protein PhrA
MGTVNEETLWNTSKILKVDSLLDGSLMNLSNGQQRRARIVKALLHKPEILLLDEPYSIPCLILINQKSGFRCIFSKDAVDVTFEPC